MCWKLRILGRPGISLEVVYVYIFYFLYTSLNVFGNVEYDLNEFCNLLSSTVQKMSKAKYTSQPKAARDELFEAFLQEVCY